MDPAGDDLKHVVVTNFRMPFWSMVFFMVKWSIAAIPAFIILLLVGAAAIVLLAGMFPGLLKLLALAAFLGQPS